MEIVGFEPRHSDLARGIVIARSARPLDATTQQALWNALADAGVTANSEDDAASHATDPDRQLLAAPWLPPSAEEVEAQRLALEAAAIQFDLEAVWFVKVETGCDGLAWEPPENGEGDDASPGEAGGREVLYAAPDVPLGVAAEGEVEREDDEDDQDDQDTDDDDADDDDSDDDDSDELPGDVGDEAVQLESHWRNGPPPFQDAVPFPLERYPDILDNYDAASFGIAVKLAGQPGLGAESVVNAFFALWLSVYQDERNDDFEPFQRADVIHDRKHHAALMWVEKFSVPVTVADQVHFLLWIATRLHTVLPIAWARFDSLDDVVRAHADVDEGEPFVLAGNPFADLFHHQGEPAALAWGQAQQEWSARELAGMMVEVALEHDPDDGDAATTAERLLRRAQALEPSSDAAGYLAIVLVRQRRCPEAVALAHDANRREIRLLVLSEIAEHAPLELAAALELIDATILSYASAEDIAEFVATVARFAAPNLATVLDRLPDDAALIAPLYNISFTVDRPLALAILLRVIALPDPPSDAGEPRTALTMAWNNACIHAHALGDYQLAVQLASGGQRFAAENPYIFHSAACAYAAAGQIDRAIIQVAMAIEHDYDHSEKMETDRDLSALHSDPRFPALFAEWRAKRADLN